MADSSSYWRFAEAVEEEAAALAAAAKDARTTLENTDDPGILATDLSAIKTKLDHVSAQIGPALPTLRKASQALETIPKYKGT